MNRRSLRFLIILANIVLSCAVWAGNDAQAQLQANIEAVQNQAAILKYKMQYPEATRVLVVVSVSNQADYLPVKISVSVDGKEQAFHTYRSEDIEALKAGGMQSLWLGNVAAGAHQLTALVDGVRKNGKPVQFNAKLSFQKGQSAKFLELQIKEETGDSPSFAVKDGGNE